MGQTLLGSPAKQTGKAGLMTKEQTNFLNSLIANLGPQAQGAFPGLLEGFNEETFQKGVVDPAMRTYQRDILPSIEQRFTDENAGMSSALNQALASSAEDLSNVLAGQRVGYEQFKTGNQQNALAQILSLLGQKQYAPIVQGPQTGLLQDIVSGASEGAGKVGANALLSAYA